jgi:YidC/Oxa1 family membrane protein insertase
MDDQNRNLILATALSMVVILVWFVLFPPPEAPVDPNAPLTETAQPAETGTGENIALTPPAAGTGTTAAAVTDTEMTEVALDEAARIAIETAELTGSISLRGGRIDDLSLRDYNETLEEDSPIVRLLAPTGGAEPYYALYGWAPAGELDFEQVPGADTPWQLESGETLGVGSPVTLVWDNGNGLVFRRTIAVDDKFMFSVTQEVENTSDAEVRLAPYGIVARHGLPDDLQNFFILHEGVVRKVDGQLDEIGYDNVTDLDFVERERAQAEVVQVEESGWIGFTDKYWMTTLIPGDGQPFTSVTRYVASADIYQTEARLPVMSVAPGATGEVTTLLFAGAKEWETIRDYQDAGRHRPVHRLDRLGLVLFPDQADVLAAAQSQRADREHGPRHHRADRHRQGRAFPAGLQILRLHGPHARAAAGDGEDQGTRRRRPPEAPAADDGALQEGKGEPRLGLSADPPADPDLLLALQGDLRHAGTAPRALDRLDQGPFGAGPVLDHQPLRPPADRRARARLSILVADLHRRVCRSASASRCGCSRS